MSNNTYIIIVWIQSVHVRQVPITRDQVGDLPDSDVVSPAPGYAAWVNRVDPRDRAMIGDADIKEWENLILSLK